MMEAADEPAEIHFILDKKNATPGRAVAGAVSRHEQHAGDHLNHKHERQGAAPDVAPFRSAGNILQKHDISELAVAGALI